MKERLYYIVGVSLLVLLVLVVYVGSRVQDVEIGLVNVDSRLSAIEARLKISPAHAARMDAPDADLLNTPEEYGASLFDAFSGVTGPIDQGPVRR